MEGHCDDGLHPSISARAAGAAAKTNAAARTRSVDLFAYASNGNAVHWRSALARLEQQRDNTALAQASLCSSPLTELYRSATLEQLAARAQNERQLHGTASMKERNYRLRRYYVFLRETGWFLACLAHLSVQGFVLALKYATCNVCILPAA
jgi:hypothetical protein